MMARAMRGLTLAGLSVAVVCGVGRAQCPAHSHLGSDIIWKSTGELPHDGWAVYNDGSRTYVTRLKSPSPQEVLDPSGKSMVFKRTAFSPDGKWIIGSYAVSNYRELGILRVNDRKVFGLGLRASEQVDWWHNSPVARPWDQVYEVGFIVDTNATEAWAVEVDLSNPDNPRVGRSRKIIERMNTQMAEFQVKGDLVVWDADVSYLYTIPNGGRGVANKDLSYPVAVGRNNCATSLAPSVKYWAFNSNHRRDDVCVPGNHDGVVVIKTKHATDTRVSADEWTLDTAKGAVSLCYVPETIDGISQRQGTDNHWFGWRFMNNEDYVCSMHLPATGQENKGGHIVDYRTGTWYELVPSSRLAQNLIAWFDGVPMPAWEDRPAVRVEFVSPAADTVFHVGDPVKISVSANSENGTITKVLFFDNGQQLGEDTQAPYEWTIAAVTEGNHALAAQAYDNSAGNAVNMISIRGENDPVYTSIGVVPDKAYTVTGASATFAAVALDQYGRPMQGVAVNPTWRVPADAGTVGASTGIFVPGSTFRDSWHTVSVADGARKGEGQMMIVTTKPFPARNVTDMLALKRKVGGMRNFPQAWGCPANTILPIQNTEFLWKGVEYSWQPDHYDDGIFALTTEKDARVFWGLSLATTSAREFYLSYRARDFIATVTLDGQSLPGFGTNAKTAAVTDPEGIAGSFTLEPGLHHVIIELDKDMHIGRFMTVRFTDAAGNNLSGIEYVLLSDSRVIAEGYKILSPKAGDSFRVGDTLLVEWLAAADITESDMEITVDNGKTWIAINTEGSIARASDQWGLTRWAIPEQASHLSDGRTVLVPMANTTAKVRVREYGMDGQWEAVSEAFAILPSAALESRLVVQHLRAPTIRLLGQTVVFSVPRATACRIELVDPRGRLVRRVAGPGATSVALPLTRLSAGTYIVRASGGGATMRRTVLAR